MDICCECCVLSGRGFRDELLTCPEESYRLWCVVVCDLETSRMRRPWSTLGRRAIGIYIYITFFTLNVWRLLNRITQNSYVTVGRKYFHQGPHATRGQHVWQPNSAGKQLKVIYTLSRRKP
jgi:hypothetical protein